MKEGRTTMLRNLLGLAFIVGGLSVLGAPPLIAAQPTETVQDPLATGPTDPEELEAFFAPFFENYVAEAAWPSAAVVVVKHDAIFFQKGYGFTDTLKTQPVTAKHTIFRAASVSKLFIATAIMQLAEQGKLRLDDDVNRYLEGPQLHDTFPEPVTVAHLLTHTSGLEEPAPTERPSAKPNMTIREYVAGYTPSRIYPPGDQINYSNQGTGLATYIVEVISGMPFYEYATRYLLEPLGMRQSSFQQPIPAPLQAAFAAHRFDDAGLIAPYPVATLVSTASDMGQFMIAHLNGGRIGERQILQAATVADMHTRQFSPHSHMPGIAYGFFECLYNSRRILFHTGARDHFSLLALVPEQNIGIYIVMAGDHDEADLREEVIKAFLDRYYPPEASTALQATTANAQRTERFEGLYRLNMIPRNSIMKASGLPSDMSVAATEGGTLTLAGALTMTKAEPLLFKTEKGDFLSFREDSDGRITHMFVNVPFKDSASLTKIAWYEGGLLHGLLIGLSGLVFFLFALVACIRTLLRLVRPTRRASAPAPGGARLAWRVAVIASTLFVLSPVSGLLMMLTRDSMPWEISQILYVVLSLLLLATASGLALPVFAGLAWKHTYWSVGARVVYSVVALAALLVAPLLLYWNLLGYQF